LDDVIVDMVWDVIVVFVPTLVSVTRTVLVESVAVDLSAKRGTMRSDGKNAEERQIIPVDVPRGPSASHGDI
jgi:hypothetical protein